MNALILAGGFGTRLRPLTFSTPKPLVPFCNKPIVEHQIEALKSFGVVKIILAVSDDIRFSSLLENFVDYASKFYKIEIILSVEKTVLDTGGAIALAKPYIESDYFFVLNSDVVCNYPFSEILQFHKNKKGLGTILTTEVKNPSKYGVVISDENERIVKFCEKPKLFVGNNINAGIYCFSKAVLDMFEMRKLSIEKEIFPKLSEQKLLYQFKLSNSNFWADIGKPVDFIKGMKLFIDHTTHDKIIEKTAKIDPSAFISKHAVIGKNCIISKNSVIKNSIVFDGAIIKEGAVVTDSIVGWNCVVGSESKIMAGSVLEKSVTVCSGVNLESISVCAQKSLTKNVEFKKVVW